MENPQLIRKILADKKAASAKSSLCSSCYNRPKYEDRDWCRRCILAWQRDPEPDEHGILHRDYKNTIYDGCSLEGNIPERYRGARMEHLPDAIRQAVKSLPDDKGLFLWGPPGVGKTYAPSAIEHQFYFDGSVIKRKLWDMLCLEIRDTFGRGHSELNIVNSLVRVEKLFIEDVGVTVSIGKQESDFSLRTFLVVLDQRLEQCRATFITSNKSVEEIGKSFDARIASRLQQACKVFKLEGRDRRISEDKE